MTTLAKYYKIKILISILYCLYDFFSSQVTGELKEVLTNPSELLYYT